MGSLSRCFLLVVAVFSFTVSGKIFAHDLGVVRAELTEKEYNTYSLVVKLPIQTDIRTPPPVLPEGFIFVKEPYTVVRQTYSVTYYEFANPDGGLGHEDILFLPWTLDGAFIHASWQDDTESTLLIKEGKEGIRIAIADLKSPDEGKFEQFKRYTILGIEHILLGWDHLAFVLALCLIARGKDLVMLVTAFTIGHSATLALAVMEVIQLPILPVEACIAFSIALVAKEFFSKKVHSSLNSWIVIAFGLLHGLGFASVLAEIGIDRTSLLLGLFSFNLGVELGQLFFVLAVLMLFYMVRSTVPAFLGNLQRVMAFFIGVLGFYWFIERLALFL